MVKTELLFESKAELGIAYFKRTYTSIKMFVLFDNQIPLVLVIIRDKKENIHYMVV